MTDPTPPDEGTKPLPGLPSGEIRESRLWDAIGFTTNTSRHPENPEITQDTHLVYGHSALAGVFDGMDKQGDVAAQILLDNVRNELHILEPPAKQSFERHARSAFLGTAKYLQEQGIQGDATAAVAQIIAENGNLWVGIAHSGDSRACVLYKDGMFSQVTTDQNAQNMYLRRAFPEIAEFIDTVLDHTANKGDRDRFFDQFAIHMKSLQTKYEDLTSRIDHLSEQDARIYRDLSKLLEHINAIRFDERTLEDFYAIRHLTHGLTSPDITFIDASNVAAVILTTDGVHDNLTFDEIQTIVTDGNNNSRSAQEISDMLVQAAMERSNTDPSEENDRPKKDDITAMTIFIPDKNPYASS